MKVEIEAAEGCVVRYEGALYLVEKANVHVELTLQRIEPVIDRFNHYEAHERRFNDGGFAHCPVFLRLQGDPASLPISSVRVLHAPKEDTDQ